MKMMVAAVVVACGVRCGGGSDAGDVVRMLEMIVVVVVERVMTVIGWCWSEVMTRLLGLRWWCSWWGGDDY
ncbi:hypothetical protein Tco_1089636, partial [Tanacetum coccineum]